MENIENNFENNFLIIDISNIIYRSYFQKENKEMKTKKGLPTNAIFNCLQKITDICFSIPSKYIALVFDTKLNFRKEIFLKEYKENRPEKEQNLLYQIPIIEGILKANGFACIKKDFFEADDLIASLVKNLYKQNIQSIIVSTDKDLMQLVNDKQNVKFFNLTDNQIYLEKQVENHFNILPNLLNDYLCLVGDSADNIKGVDGWGAKTSAKYLKEYNGLENLYNFCLNLTDEKTKDYKKFMTLKNSLNILNLNKNLITLNDNLINIKYMPDYLKKSANPKILKELEKYIEFNPTIELNF